MRNIIRRAIVTGASEGIGRAFCHRLAKEGFEIVAVARNEERLRSLVSELPGTGHAALVADLSTTEGRSRVVGAVTRGGCDVLVNNAGYGLLRPFTDESPETWLRMIELNVNAVVELSHAFLRQAERDSVLINVSSTLSFLPMPVQGVYSATKSFVTVFTEALWYQNRKRGVHVLNLCPGITATKFNARAGGEPGELPRAMTQTPEEVVDIAWKNIRRGPTKISGWKNQLLMSLFRLLPRRTLTKLLGGVRQ